MLKLYFIESVLNITIAMSASPFALLSFVWLFVSLFLVFGVFFSIASSFLEWKQTQLIRFDVWSVEANSAAQG